MEHAKKLHRRRARGFTLLEVLVAVSILGLGLTAILSAQAGAFASASHARAISVASGLLRCKMSEVEEHLYKDGFQETDESGAGPCCDGDDNPNMRCTWRVDRPTFPDAKFGDLNLGAGLDLAGGGAGQSSGGPPALGALGLLGGSASGTSPLAGASSLTDVAKTLADANSVATNGAGAPPSSASSSGGQAAGSDPGMGGLASMAMSFVYPTLKTLFEASTRRITATLTFRQGKKDYSIDVVEWFTIPQLGLAVDDPNAVDTSLSTSSSSGGGPHRTPPTPPGPH